MAVTCSSSVALRAYLFASSSTPGSWLFKLDLQIEGRYVRTGEIDKKSLEVFVTFDFSLNNTSDGIRWSMDIRWQSSHKPYGFYGLKDGLVFRDSKNPNHKIDWDSFFNIARNEEIDAAAGKVCILQASNVYCKNVIIYNSKVYNTANKLIQNILLRDIPDAFLTVTFGLGQDILCSNWLKSECLGYSL